MRLKVGALLADDARNFLGVHGTLLVLVLKHTTRDDLVHMLELRAGHQKRNGVQRIGLGIGMRRHLRNVGAANA